METYKKAKLLKQKKEEGTINFNNNDLAITHSTQLSMTIVVKFVRNENETDTKLNQLKSNAFVQTHFFVYK